MYCSTETLKLALAKGYTRCTCSAGGYPDCICEGIPYINIRLDDIQRWLYTKNFFIMLFTDFVGYQMEYAIKKFAWEVARFDTSYNLGCDGYPFTTPDDALEAGIIHALELI